MVVQTNEILQSSKLCRVIIFKETENACDIF